MRIINLEDTHNDPMFWYPWESSDGVDAGSMKSFLIKPISQVLCYCGVWKRKDQNDSSDGEWGMKMSAEVSRKSVECHLEMFSA